MFFFSPNSGESPAVLQAGSNRSSLHGAFLLFIYKGVKFTKDTVILISSASQKPALSLFLKTEVL